MPRRWAISAAIQTAPMEAPSCSSPSREARAERSPLCLRASSMAAISAGSQWMRFGDVAFFDFAVLAEGFAEVDGLVGFAVGGGPASAGYVHVHRIKHYSPILNRQLRLIIKILHVYIFRTKIDLTP